MRLTLATVTGEVNTVDVPSDMTIADLAALAASSFPAFAQLPFPPLLAINNQLLDNPTATLLHAGIHNDDLVLVSRAPTAAASSRSASHRPTPDTVTLPAPTESATTPPSHQRASMQNAINQFWSQLNQIMGSPEQREEMQRKIQLRNRIAENYVLAMEYLPEAFGDVIMLYIKGKVNGHPVKAFVDSGAQKTIMSENLAKACGLSDLIDERYAGVAQGVGTAKILGRVHAAQLEVGSGDDNDQSSSLYLMCSFTVIESDNHGVDMLFGLDMLKHHQASIDLARNALRIQDRLIPFLPEHELPETAKTQYKLEQARRRAEEERAKLATDINATSLSPSMVMGPSTSTTSSASVASPLSTSTSTSTPTTSAVSDVKVSPKPNEELTSSDESKVQQLISMGVSRVVAIQALAAAGGSVDLAASLLFN